MFADSPVCYFYFTYYQKRFSHWPENNDQSSKFYSFQSDYLYQFSTNYYRYFIYQLFRLKFESSGWHEIKRGTWKVGESLSGKTSPACCSVLGLPVKHACALVHTPTNYGKGLFPDSKIFMMYFSFFWLRNRLCYLCLIIYKLGRLSTDCSLSFVRLTLVPWLSLC